MRDVLIRNVGLAVSAKRRGRPPLCSGPLGRRRLWRRVGRDGQPYIKMLLCVLLLQILPPIAIAESDQILKQRIHELVESGDYSTALSEGVDAITEHPDSPELLHEVGRAAYRSNRYHLAIYYFKQSLRFRPNYGATLLYLGWAQKRANLTGEARETFSHVQAVSKKLSEPVRNAAVEALKQLGPEPPMAHRGDSLTARSRRFFVAAPYAALLEYGGKTPKVRGETFQFDLRAGLLGRGYIEFSEAWTSVETLPSYPDYEVVEHRIGLAGFVSPQWLLKGKYALLDADYEGGGTGHFYALGADWLRRGKLRGGLSASLAEYPDGDVTQVMPRMTWRAERFELATTLSIQQWAPDDSSEESLALLRQDLLVPLARGDGISVGYAAGESRYGHAGFGDVLYSLPDRQTGSIYFRYARPITPFMLSLKTSIDTFKTDEGNSYHSTAHTISLGYLSRNARAARSVSESPWTLSVGAGFRENRAQLTMVAADPLVTDVIDPVTFSDDSGDYTRVYAYDLETGIGSREREADDRALSPYIELRRAQGHGEGSGLSVYGRYTFAPSSYTFESEQVGYQRVWESYTDLYTGTEFGGGRDVYATYSAAQQGRFDLNLHELALGVEAAWRVLPQLHLGTSAGLLFGIADWSATDSTSWTEDGDSEVLSWVERQDAGQEFLLGAAADLRFRWAPSARSPWILELTGGYAWYDDLTINSTPIAGTFELASFNGTIGIGLR